ncbi:MAG TPA: phosphatidate cytidylyltransferase [Gammaproteobacteria bacterium]|jgi:phosphatidate cytidylyltransferase|nr:phosphatidate cytidylyltransferase [Gammaproteobacteria bacterium]
MLKQRIITAVILVPIVLFLLFFASPPLFCIVTGLVVLMAAYEWTNLIPLHHTWQKLLYLFIFFDFMFLMLFVQTPLIFAVTFFWWLAALILVLIYPRGSHIWSSSKLIKGIMGALVLIPCWVAINFIRNGNEGIFVLFFIFILIWGADTTAYFAGKKWGTIKLAPLVSPGKSVQGVISALVYAVVITILTGLLSQPPLVIIVSAVILAVVTVAFSILGDLFESMMKREVGLKDSSNILPGHGGLLDRIDSLTAAAPIYALGGLLLSMFFS